MLSDIINTAVKMLKDRVSGIDKHALTSDSLIEYTRSTRTEPITMIDHTIINQPELSDLMATLTTIYAAMYSQAFSIAINHEIGSIKALKALDKINPNRGVVKPLLGLESHSLLLPDYRNIENNYKATNKISMEGNFSFNGGVAVSPNGGIGFGAKAEYDSGPNVINVNKNKGKDEFGVKTEAITKFNQNLTTGILFDVSVSANGTTLNVPLSVRLLANEMRQDNVLSILKAAVVNKTAKERYREWRAGGLSFWSDIVLCRDILKEQRKNLIKDQTGIYNEVIKRRNNNKLAGIFSGDPSISNISNILVVSTETIARFETETFKKLKDAKVRDTIFNNTNVMVLAVVDAYKEVVTLYYHSISVPTIVTFRDLKSYTKKQGLDPMEVLRSFQMGGMNGIRL